MGRLLREIMEDQKEQFIQPTEEMLPELMLLGTLEHRELSLQSGQIILMDVINYDGRNYAMKTVNGGKWFGELSEIKKDGNDSVYDEVRFKH